MNQSNRMPDVTVFAAIMIVAASVPVVYAIAAHNPIPIIGGVVGLLILTAAISIDEQNRIKSLPSGLWMEPLTIMQLLYFATGAWIACAGIAIYSLAVAVSS